ncbi:MAG: peptide deformylase [Zetaproteobacteria bacterium]|nr:peptide deformylase [Zetaproteobacteria bacterium]
MTIRKILIYPDDQLRSIATPIADPTSAEIGALIQDLADTMYDAPGVGLAAPQIGISLRIAVTDTHWRSGRYEGVGAGEGPDRRLNVWINPEILWRSDVLQTYEEGCLSLPEMFADVSRPAAIRLRWLDEHGNKHERDFEGFEAVALQHEFDHLDGRVFIDHLSVIKRKMIHRKLLKRKKMMISSEESA